MAANEKTVQLGIRMILGLSLCLLGWFWLSWPSRAAREFVVTVEAGETGKWMPNIVPPAYGPEEDETWNVDKLVSHERTLNDYLKARQKFSLEVESSGKTLPVSFEVRRGKIFNLEADFVNAL